MNVTRCNRSLLAGPRRGFASVLTVMFLVLTMVSTGVLCGFHLDDHPHGGPQAHHGGGQLATQAMDAPAFGVSAAGPTGDGWQGCSDHHLPSAQCDSLLPVPSPGPAAMPEPSVRRLVTAAVHDDTPVPANTAEATAPSLHALGISRT
jgi:hypothetical protein